MYAIVEIAGQQFKVEKDKKIFVHRLEGNEGEVVEMDRVLLIEDDKQVIVGEPLINGAMVSGKILSHPKGDKVIVFKKKRRKGYKVKKGHRQAFTELLIEGIMEKGYVKKEKPAAAKPAPKVAKEEKAPVAEKEAPVKAETPKASKTAATKKEVKPADEKKAPAKKSAAAKPAPAKKAAPKAAPAEKKPAAKKPAAKKPAAGKSGKKES